MPKQVGAYSAVEVTKVNPPKALWNTQAGVRITPHGLNDSSERVHSHAWSDAQRWAELERLAAHAKHASTVGVEEAAAARAGLARDSEADARVSADLPAADPRACACALKPTSAPPFLRVSSA